MLTGPVDLKEDSSGILDQEESAYVVRKKFIEIGSQLTIFSHHFNKLTS